MLPKRSFAAFTALGVMLAFALMFLNEGANAASRIKDIANYIGARDNQLVGYGLVMGLEGTGDKDRTIFTMQSMANMLKEFGMNIDPTKMKVKNVAAVMVTSNLPPFAKPGDRLDVTVSSIGDATNLQGGYLLLTPLKGVDGNVYALGQGPVSIGGFNFTAGGGGAAQGMASAQKNHTTVGRIPDGAVVEKNVAAGYLSDDGTLYFALRNADFTTASRLSKAINQEYQGTSRAVDAGTVEVKVPERFRTQQSLVPFLESIESLLVNPDTPAKIVINEKTGTIVAGGNVRISTVAVSHGNLHLTVRNQITVSQPEALASGQTVAAGNVGVGVSEEAAKLILLPEGVTIQEIVDALNSLGVTPRDMISIFQTIKEAGALQAELVII